MVGMLSTAFESIEALGLARLRNPTSAILADLSIVTLLMLIHTHLAWSKC